MSSPNRLVTELHALTRARQIEGKFISNTRHIKAVPSTTLADTENPAQLDTDSFK